MATRDLVLLPGWAMPTSVFDPLLPLLPAHWRVHRPALPVTDNVAAMASVLLDNAPPCAVWLGWSLGGMVAAQAACLQPSRVAALLTLATNLRFVDGPDWPDAMPAATFSDFSVRVAAEPADALSRFQALVARGGACARADQRALRGLCAGQLLDPPGLRCTLRALGEADLRADVAGLSRPSLWLHGEHDALVPSAVSAAIARCVPGACTRVLPGQSHVPFLSAPSTVADAIESFLPETG